MELVSESFEACILALAHTCQVLAGEVFLNNRWPDADRLVDVFASVPAPQSYPEALVAVEILTRFVNRLAIHLHSLLHTGTDSARCAFDPLQQWQHIRLDPGACHGWSAATTLRTWLSRYAAASDAHHGATLAMRAKREIDLDPKAATTAASLARRLGCSRSVLQRWFAVHVGETLLDYRTRVRTLTALKQLWYSDQKSGGGRS